MTNQEMVRILRGTHQEKLSLFNDMVTRAANGEQLSDDELPILEALKKDLIKPESKIVSLEAGLVGKSNAGVK